MTRIDAENKRKIADVAIKEQELIQKKQEMLLDFELKIKEIALKYNTQLDTTKIKADAELDKMIVANNSKALEQAQKSANMYAKQIQGLNGEQRPSQESEGVEQILSGQTDFRE